MKAAKHTNKKLGQILVESGVLNMAQLKKSIAEQKKTGKRIGEVFVRLGFIGEVDIARTLSVQLGLPYLDISTAVVEPEAVSLISEELAKKHLILPVSMDASALVVAMADPLNLEAIKDIGFCVGRYIKPSISTATNIRKAIKRHYHLTENIGEVVDKMDMGFLEVMPEGVDSSGTKEDDIDEVIRKGEAPPIIKLANSILYNAIKERASDIHIIPQPRSMLVKHRVDGVLVKSQKLPKWVQGAVTSRLKIMAGMDIAEKRLPQDGRIKVRVEGGEVDLRISSLPTQYGEDIVIRILDSQAAVLELPALGLLPRDTKKLKSLVERTQGTVLVTGPTGSGKSSTLYALLNYLKCEEVNIITLEDPIEFELKGAKQVAIREKIGLTFASGLRSVLRQDPDIIMVGEMRDAETSSIAFQASLTGHIVLSTLHTNTAIATITRLRNQGIPAYMIASSLNGVVAQRLVRKLCQSCRESYSPPAEELLKLGLNLTEDSDFKFFKAVGCKECNKKGYKGRIGVFEILVCTRTVMELIVANASEDELRKAAVDDGMRNMAEDALEKVMKGMTTVDEVMRVLYIGGEEDIHICQHCGASVRPDFLACPFCSRDIVERCGSCGKEKEEGWKSCPYCRDDFGSPSVKVVGHDM